MSRSLSKLLHQRPQSTTPEILTLIVSLAPSLRAFRHMQLAGRLFCATPSQQFAVRCRWRTLDPNGAYVLPSGLRDGPHVHEKYSGNAVAFHIYRNGRRHGLQYKKCDIWFRPGPIFSQCMRVDGKRHGIRRARYLSGQLYIQSMYADGKLQGEYRSWYESGQLKIQGTYIDGELHGEYRTWYKSGQLRMSRTYVAGLRQGIAYAYYESGQLQIQGECIGDNLHGAMLYHYESGQLAEQCTYVNGVRHGSRFRYYESGQLRKHTVYVDGVKQMTNG